jgi:hypothetical protein
VRDYKSAYYTSLNNASLNCLWDEEVFNTNDFDDVYSNFLQNVNECINRHIPKKNVAIKPKDKVFMTNTISRLMWKKNRTHPKAVRITHYIGVDTGPYVIKSLMK